MHIRPEYGVGLAILLPFGRLGGDFELPAAYASRYEGISAREVPEETRRGLDTAASGLLDQRIRTRSGLADGGY